jgi:DHA1 family tetracycline resistance protein-like MFS transporter
VRSWGLTRNLAFLIFSLALWGLGFGLYGVLWPLYIEHLGGGPAVIGVMQAVAGIATAGAAVAGGRWADRLPAKRLLLVGWAVAVPAPLIFLVAPRWPWLFPGVILYFGSAFSTPALQTYIVREAGNRLAVAYNVVMAAFTLGAVLGPTLGGFLVAVRGFSWVFGLAALCYALSTLLLLPLADREPPRLPGRGGSRARPTPWLDAQLTPWLLLAIVTAATASLAMPYVVPFWRQVGSLSVRDIGMLGSVGTLLAGITHPLWGRAAERRGLANTVAWGLLLGAVGMGTVAAAPGIPWLQAAGAALRGAGAGTMGLVGVAVGRVASPDRAGSAYGWFNALTELAGAAAPYPGSLLYKWRPSAPIVVASLLWTLLAVWVATRPPRHAAALARAAAPRGQ